MRALRLLSVVVVVGATLLLTGAPAGADPATECTGGLAPGDYGRVVVPENAVCFAEPPVNIHGDLTIKPGATFVLGSEENPTWSSITGNVKAHDAANVQIHFTEIWGKVNVKGGSGPFFEGSPFCDPAPPDCITWNTIEDSIIHRNVKVQGYNGFWHGFIRNTVYGSVNLTDNVVVDPDGNEFVTNTIHGNLKCKGNDPAPQVGDSGGSPNVVTGKTTGQCVQVF